MAKRFLMIVLCIAHTLFSLMQEGRSLALAALGHLQTEASEACRIALIHSPKGQQGEVSLRGRAALAASRLQSRRPKIGAFLGMLLHSGRGELLWRYSRCFRLPQMSCSASAVPGAALALANITCSETSHSTVLFFYT